MLAVSLTVHMSGPSHAKQTCQQGVPRVCFSSISINDKVGVLPDVYSAPVFVIATYGASWGNWTSQALLTGSTVKWGGT